MMDARSCQLSALSRQRRKTQFRRLTTDNGPRTTDHGHAAGFPPSRGWQHAPLISHLSEVVYALLVRRYHVDQTVAVDVGQLELRAGAAVVVELMASPLGSAIGAAELEPAE